ncbi:phospho-N-acetylmuramoyl-pentapeptide-transferase [Humibacter ginsenosidimutans]|uniref:Phospho-N-acetylmuramoyl-pentapeptide-transferase n=1 Tax=Humibacter ginsenosidimutans TaxID=2599293 RepID=A0A5B8M1I2_9MICO|nr:phospho-N-acetylmuramoyl-pentapeptide-transferase [Humibacter ginsenosidimutans]QDZ13675.1 phospho-N-acetylmuramoyl-pentapeptide-transferase [Humibacter ginsenosidimutans]
MRALLTAGALSLAFSLFLTPVFVKLFHRLNWGQFIRDDGPQSHHAKRGTATMGGIVIILATLVGYFVAVLINGGDGLSVSPLLVLFMMVGLGVVGFVDDFMKTRKQRSLGLGGWSKVLGQVIVATVFGILAINFPSREGVTPASTEISFIRDLPIDLMVLGGIPIVGIILYLIWINLIATAASNSVNVTDGLDGLATGASILAIGSYIIIGFWQFNQSCFSDSIDKDNLFKCYTVRDPLDLAVVAAAIVGALVGFLWWNTSPAQIFLGDTGSLALGGALAALAILSHTELLLVLIGGLFVIESGSVILQRAYFKATRGKRIFRMSPIHHHFELKGWAEVTVVVRFWIIGGLLVAAGVGSFYLEWLSRTS